MSGHDAGRSHPTESNVVIAVEATMHVVVPMLEPPGAARAAYSPPSNAGETSRLVRALLTMRDAPSADARRELDGAAGAFAWAFRASRVPPEQLVIALKELFNRLDGRVPTLAEVVGKETPSISERACGAWYPAVFIRCVETYFAVPLRSIAAGAAIL